MPKKSYTYIDTSVWCAYCFNEQGSERAIDWLGSADLSLMGTSWWTESEFASAMGIQCRKKALTAHQARSAHARFSDLLAMVTRLNVLEQDYLLASEYCIESAHGLRGGDALHLAIAKRHGCVTVATLDKDMQVNAKHLGMKLIELK